MIRLLFLILLTFIHMTQLQADNEKLEHIKIKFQWKYQFQFAGFIVAQEKGYYKEFGLDVELLEYDFKDFIQELENGKVDYITNNSSIIFQDKKLKDFMLLATYLHRSPLVLATQPNIKTPNDLDGKTIMINDEERLHSTLSLLFEYYNLNDSNTKFIPHNFKLDDFIDKKVDALALFRSNEVFLLNEKNVSYNIIDPVDYGFTTTAINLFTTHKNAKDNPQQVRKILQATKKGWEYALENLNEVAQLIHQKYRPDLSLKHLQYEAKLTKELMTTNLFNIGEINQEFIYKTFNQLKQRKLLDSEQSIEDKIFALPQSYQNQLTKEELEWIQTHPFITYSEVNWKPLSIIKDGKMEGIMGDYLDKISNYTGLQFKYIPSKSWDEVLEKFEKNEIDVIPGISTAKQGKSLGLISDVYDTYPMLIITDKSYRFINNLAELKTKTIAVPKYYTSYNFITNKYPDIKIIPTKDIPEALQLVVEGKADVFVGHAATSLYYMAQMEDNNLHIAGNTSFNFEHRYLVQRDQQILLSIINKALHNISENEKSFIRSKWLRATVKKQMDYTLLWIFLFFFAITTLFFLYRHRVVEKHQRETQQLNDRIQLALDGSKSGIWDWDFITDEVYFSSGWKKILGYKDHEIQNSIHELETRVHPEDLEQTMGIINKALRGEIGNFRVLFRMKNKHGKWVWINSVAKVFFNEAGKAFKLSGTHTDISIQKEAQDQLLEQKMQLDHLAHHDPLTGLANRILFTDRLSEAIKNAKRTNTKLALFFIDLDHFKEINDSLGHATGDELLKIVTAILEQTIHNSDTVARLGGDEFTILRQDLESIDDASHLATEILNALSKPLNLGGSNFYISCSIGISIFPDDGLSAENLLKFADTAMYKAKSEGRNNFQFYSADMTELAFERVIMESALREAIHNEEFMVYYQPQVNALDNTIIGLEALVRWKHPQMGIVPPSKFILLAERTGLILELDYLVMKIAMTQVSKWDKEGLFNGKLSLNLSVKQLQSKHCIENFKELIATTGCRYDQVELEVTEGQVMTDPENAIEILKQINQLGISLSIDDFGTGYSSLAYLKRLPINKLKIDRSFVKDLPDDEEDKAITKTIIALATTLNLDIIAEGIETEEQKEFVLEHGCHKIQGYYYYQPMPAADIEKILKELTSR